MKELSYGSIIALEIKSDEGDAAELGQFKGYASTFNKDVQGDRIEAGAFAATIAEKKAFPILLFHNQQLWAGNTTFVEEDKRGLKIEAQLNLDTSMGRDAWGILKGAKNAGFPVGMSVGFVPGQTVWDDKTQTRLIKDLELYEVSLTPWPANRSARVSALKSALNVRILERYVRDATGCSGEVAKRIISFTSSSISSADAVEHPLALARDGRSVVPVSKSVLRDLAKHLGENTCRYK